MDNIHAAAPPGSEGDRLKDIVVVICAYAFAPGASGEAGRCWCEAVELAQAGFDVWVVTRSDERAQIECALARSGIARLHVLFWDAPASLRPLQQRGRFGSRVHCALWYRLVGNAIADWQRAIGMYALRRVVHRSGASVAYLTLPPVQRAGRAGFAWRAQSQ